ncbi:MAG: AAA family ATPase, partial [Cytophagales bacterium]
MVKTLSISNYKSIRQLDIKASRVNVFIGEHNSGKSNILEALSWLSVGTLDANTFPEVFRFKNASDFFYDFDATKIVEVRTNELNLGIKYGKSSDGALRNEFDVLIYNQNLAFDFLNTTDFHNLKGTISDFYYSVLLHSGKLEFRAGFNTSSQFRTYIFKRIRSFQNSFRPFLNPPFGENIPSLLISNKSYQELVRDLFKSKGFRLMLKPSEGDISMAKDVNDELYAYPFQAISETLQRMVFYTLAIESNKNAILILDEPEANTFPMYTKQ